LLSAKSRRRASTRELTSITRHHLCTNRARAFGFEDREVNALRALVSVLSQHCLQIDGGQAASTETASVDLSVADQHFERRIDEPSNPRNEAESESSCGGPLAA
jgi:hypothetical protein